MDLTGYFIHAPLSAFYTLLLGMGMAIVFDKAGKFFFKTDELWQRAMYFFAGLLVTSWTILLLSLFGLISVLLLNIISAGFIVTATYLLFKTPRDFFLNAVIKAITTERDKPLFSQIVLYAVYLSLFCFLIISLAPPTDADSLDYHLGIPLEILRTGNLLLNKDFLHFRFVGFGEMINLLGVANGCPQLSTFLQLIGLVWLLSVYASAVPEKTKITILSLVLGVPLLLFLLPNQKNQLTGIICTSLCFYAIAFHHHKLNGKIFSLFTCLLVFAIGIKYSFILSAGALLVYVFIKNKNLKLSVKHVLNITLGSIIFLSPIYIYKYIYFGDALSPLFETYKSSPEFVVLNFAHYIKQYTDSAFSFPLNLIVPSSLGNTSTVLGWSAVILLFSFVYSRQYIVEITVVALFILLTIFLGQKTSRFFLEPYFWILPVFLIRASSIKWMGSLLIPGQIQFILLLPFFAYAVYILTPGIVSNKGRERVMEKYAYCYAESRWINATIPQDEIVATATHSRALLRGNIFPREYFQQIFNTDAPGIESIHKMLKEYRVKYIVLTPQQVDIIPTEYNLELITGPKKFYKATRNMFNRKEYQLVIYKLQQ